MLCAVCETGWYRRRSSAVCTQCPSNMSESIAFTAAFSFGIALVVIGLVLLDLRFGWSRSKAGSQRLKLMVNCVQQMTVMILFPVNWPDAVKEMGALFASFSLDVSIVSPTCLGVPMNYYNRFGISAGLVFAGIIMPWIVAALVSLITACRGGSAGGGQRKRRQGGTRTAAAGGRDGAGGADHMEDIAGEGDGVGGGGRSTSGESTLFAETFRATWRRVQPTAARYSLMVMLFAHPALSGQTFFFFSCRAIDGDEYLVADYSLRCGLKDAEWRRLLPFALFMVVFFVIGIPLLLLVLLVKHRAMIKKIGRAFDESRAEVEVLEELGENVDIDKARALYRKVDIDHSGSINFAQFTKFQLIQNEAEAETSSEMVNIVKMITKSKDSPKEVESLGRRALGLMNARVGRGRSIQRRSTASVIGNALRTFHDAAQEDEEDADVSLDMVVADGVGGVEGRANTENQEVDASTETKGAAEDEETRPRASTRRARLVAAHILHQDASHAMAGDVQGAILAKERAAAEKDGVEMMLGVLWMNYKPECFFFDM